VLRSPDGQWLQRRFLANELAFIPSFPVLMITGSKGAIERGQLHQPHPELVQRTANRFVKRTKKHIAPAKTVGNLLI